MKRIGVDGWTAVGAGLLLAVGGALLRKKAILDMQALPQSAWFWDAQILAKAGAVKAAGGDPYAGAQVDLPSPLPFVSPPPVAEALGWIAGPAVLYVLVGVYVVGLVGATLALSRMSLGRGAPNLVLGLGLLLGGLSAYSFQSLLAGNFGVVLYFALFAALVHALASGRWLWFHVAVVIAVQLKPPFAAFWVVPLLIRGWSWRELMWIGVAALAALVPYALTYLLDPSLYAHWFAGLGRQLADDLGFGIYGAAVQTPLFADGGWPLLAIHVLCCLGLFALLVTDRSTGPMKAVALVAFAIVANPRMKEYDLVFAAIATAGLIIAAVAPKGGGRGRAIGIGVATFIMIFLLAARRWGSFGDFALPATIAGGIIAWVLRHRASEAASRA